MLFTTRIDRRRRRLLATVACAAVVSSLGSAAFAQVPGQPYASYWSAGNQLGNSILNWDPTTDPDAAFNRSSVALAPRIATPYNVNPNARVNQGGVTSLVAFAGTSQNPSQGSATQNIYAPGYWQYTDTMVFWGGSAGEGSILAPNSTVIDAAHRNGTRILGNVFLPPTAYGGSINEVNAFLQKDASGRYPVADKMIQAARYYGFDGWFINQETAGGNSATATAMQGFLKYVKQQAPELHIQYYDAMNESGNVGWQGALNNNNDAFFDTDAAANSGKVSDSMFLDFAWGGSATSLNNSAAKATSLGRSPYELYAGVDFESNHYGIAGNVDTVFGNGGNHRTSLGIYRPEYTYNDSDKGNRQDFYARDSVFWVGQNGDPSNTSTSNAWKGIANYVPAKSTVIGSTFATNFNKGTGNRYMINGQQLASGDWNNLSLQDVEPTYQWIVSSTGTKLTPAFTHADAYNGGTSINIGGTLNAINDIKLYQTQLSVAADSKFKIVLKPSQSNPMMKLAVAFTDAPDSYTYLSLPASMSPNSWNTVTLDLGAFAGKTIANIGLRFGDGVTAPISNYNTRLGQFVVYRGVQSNPAAPTSPTIDSEVAVSKAAVSTPTFPLRLRWNRSTDSAYTYNIFRRSPFGQLSFVGSTPNNAYYVPSISRLASENFVTLEFETVGQDFGVSSTRTTKSFYVDWSRTSQTLTYKSAPGTTGGTGTWNATDLNWNAGASAPADQYWSNNWGDIALFTGAAGTVTVAAPLNVGGMTFATNGYTIAGTSPITLNGQYGAPGRLTVNNATDTATITAPISSSWGIIKQGAGTVAITNNTAFNGTSGITAGTLAAGAEFWIGNSANGTFTQSGGAVTANNWAAVGRNNGAAGIYNLNAGSFTKNGSADNHLILGGLGGVGTFNQNGGTVAVTAGNTLLGENNGGSGTYNLNSGAASLHDIVLSFAGTATGTFNLNGGTLDASAIRRGGGTGSAAFNFNGGTLRPTADNAAFLQGITAATVLNGGARIDTNGFAITIAQSLLPGSGSTGGLTKLGAGTLTLASANNYAGNTTVSGGTLLVAADGSLPSASSLTIGSGAVVSLSAPAETIHTQRGLTIAADGSLDMGDDALRVDYAAAGSTSPVAAIRAALAAGYSGGSWTGASGIASSVAAAATPGRRAVGYVDNGSSLLVAYTFAGDTNLDGNVDFGDLLTLAKHYNQSGAGWAEGDFTYDPNGTVGFADLLILAKNYGAGVTGVTPQSAMADARFQADFASVASAFGSVDPASMVPEPTLGGLVVLAAASIGRRWARG